MDYQISSCEIFRGTEDVMFFNVMMDLIPFKMILALFQFDAKYFL